MHQNGVGVRLLGIGTSVELRGRQILAAREGELAIATQLAGYADEPVELFGVTAATWFFLTPPLETMATLRPGWIATRAQ